MEKFANLNEMVESGKIASCGNDVLLKGYLKDFKAYKKNNQSKKSKQELALQTLSVYDSCIQKNQTEYIVDHVGILKTIRRYVPDILEEITHPDYVYGKYMEHRYGKDLGLDLNTGMIYVKER